MRTLKLITMVLLILLVTCFQAVSAQNRVRSSELDRMPLYAGPLKITITKFRGSVMKLGNATIEVDVQNTSTKFETYSPHLLSFVGVENGQVNVFFTFYGDKILRAADRKIAPGAWIKESYILTGKVHLPARVYYDEKLLIEITE